MDTKDPQRQKKKSEEVALYLDDQRTPLENPPGKRWFIVRSYKEFTDFITGSYKASKRLPPLISFDHDLCDEHINYFLENGRPTDYTVFTEKTGMHCAQWLVLLCEKNNLSLEEVTLAVHSANPGGAENIQTLLNDFKRKQLGPSKGDCFLMRWPNDKD